MTMLIIARHGNTFAPGQTPRRVGAHTDLPLVESGHEQARRIGKYISQNNILPDIVYTSYLQRTIQTAAGALDAAGHNVPIQHSEIFNEIDYGPDENQTEDLVKARIGEQALINWDRHGILPQGWSPDPADIIASWQTFGEQIRTDHPGQTILVVTSNGIARFAPHLTGDFEHFAQTHAIKLATGALGVLTSEGGHWTVQGWNIRPG